MSNIYPKDAYSGYEKAAPDALFTVEEAAQKLRISRSLLHKATARREISHIRLGKRCYYTSEDLQEYLQAHRVEAVQTARSR